MQKVLNLTSEKQVSPPPRLPRSPNCVVPLTRSAIPWNPSEIFNARMF